MKRLFSIILALNGFILFDSVLQAQVRQQDMETLIHDNFIHAANQYKLLGRLTPADRMPRSFNAKEDSLVTSNTSWWTSGFFPGSLWYIYEYTKDTVIRAEAERRLGILEKEKYHSSDHDLGFMIGNSFGNAYRITGNPAHRETVLTAARTLARRYRPQIGAIQSWDSNANFLCPVIIDNMMNLELLCWASGELGDTSLSSIAVTHANTTLRDHYRSDHSSWHVVDYDPVTGKIRGKKTAQGFADGSAWARGQSWGLYGFTMMFRFTRDSNYLRHAKNIAMFLLRHPNLPTDKIPYWDYDANNIPGTYRDVSSAAILASALLELGRYTQGPEKMEFVNTATTILRNLSGDQYRNKAGENGGFILKHSVGGLPYHSEVDVPLTYADYYFLEALLRYQKWYLK
jgi:unsaturated chondroitin disaccharide hydrolase